MHTGYILDGSTAVQRILITEDDRDGFMWARIDYSGVPGLPSLSSGMPKFLRLAPSEVFATPYLAGLAAPPLNKHAFNDAWEAHEAAQSWKAAQSDHGHTSYYGADRIREYRGFWLGRHRAARSRA